MLRKTFSNADFEDGSEEEVACLTHLAPEREALRDLNHPNIVKFLAYEEEKKAKSSQAGDHDYQLRHIYMEYCQDGDLRRYVKSRREKKKPTKALPYLTQYKVWSILADLASALAYCHHGLFKDEAGNYSLKDRWEPRLHRDIKPQNSECHLKKAHMYGDNKILVVMSTSEQGFPVAKPCDLGLTKVWDGGTEFQTRKIGTEDYFPPVCVILFSEGDASSTHMV